MLMQDTDREGSLLLSPPWLLEGYGEPQAISGPHLCATATCMRGDSNRGPKVQTLQLSQHIVSIITWTPHFAGSCPALHCIVLWNWVYRFQQVYLWLRGAHSYLSAFCAHFVHDPRRFTLQASRFGRGQMPLLYAIADRFGWWLSWKSCIAAGHTGHCSRCSTPGGSWL